MSAPVESRADDTMACLTELVTRPSRRGTAKELEPMGIIYAQARVLRTVAAAPEPLRMADLAERLDVVPRSKRQRDALTLRAAGASFSEIARQLGYSSHSGAINAVRRV